MPDFALTVDIAAPPERVWNIVADVERWPEWTPSVTSVKRYDTGPLAIGSRARIHQPKLRPADWEVTVLEPGRGFDWVTRSPGLTAIGRHWIEPVPDGSRVTIAIELTGVLARPVAWLFRHLNAQYLQLEASGLKSRAEQISS